VVNRVGYEGNPAAGDPGWNSGDIRLSPIRSDKFFPKRGSEKEEILVVECDPQRVKRRGAIGPFLRDRRIDAYQPILNRWLGE
jgi:N-carbamoylputrescine amidase